MKQKLSSFILKILGWKIIGSLPPSKKVIMTVAPHTSFMDFVYGAIAYYAMGRNPKFLIKKEFFKFPIKRLLLKAGGLPVDRSNPAALINRLIGTFNDSEEFVLIITPEGTRNKTKNWKTGFYFISKKTGIPFVVGILDYGKKEMIITKPFEKTGNVNEDMKTIKKLYIGVKAKYPNNFTCEE